MAGKAKLLSYNGCIPCLPKTRIPNCYSTECPNICKVMSTFPLLSPRTPVRALATLLETAWGSEKGSRTNGPVVKLVVSSTLLAQFIAKQVFGLLIVREEWRGKLFPRRKCFPVLLDAFPSNKAKSGGRKIQFPCKTLVNRTIQLIRLLSGARLAWPSDGGGCAKECAR